MSTNNYQTGTRLDNINSLTHPRSCTKHNMRKKEIYYNEFYDYKVKFKRISKLTLGAIYLPDGTIDQNIIDMMNLSLGLFYCIIPQTICNLAPVNDQIYITTYNILDTVRCCFARTLADMTDRFVFPVKKLCRVVVLGPVVANDPIKKLIFFPDVSRVCLIKIYRANLECFRVYSPYVPNKQL